MSRVAVCFALSFVLGAAIAGCKRGKDGAPSCDVVGAKLVLIVRQQLANGTLGEAQQRALDAQLPAMRDSLVTACGDGAWGPEVRTCLASASDHAAFEACEEELTDAQRQKLAADAK